MSKLAISVIITTFNEVKCIGDALRSVCDWADEVLIIDSFSTDDTLNVVQQFPSVKVFQRAYLGPAEQKNWAIPQAKHSWVLLMDADERVTSLLYEVIKKVIENNENCDVYRIGFQHFFMEKVVQYSGWQNDTAVRLIQRDKARYNQNQVHEEIETRGLKVGFLKGKLEHHTYKDLDTFLKKQMRYAQWSAMDYAPKTGKITAWHWCIKPFFRFFKHYVLKLGFLDGKVGFAISAIMAWGVFLRYLHISEMRRLKG